MPTEIVAEISGNHGGSLDSALLLIRHAKSAGADAVKFQCFEPERLAARRYRPDVLAIAAESFGVGYDLVELYRKVHTPKEWFRTLVESARWHEIPWFSSVFDPADVAFLETIGCPRYKISAFEMLDWDIIKAVRETGKPIVMSVRPRTGLTILHATNYSGLTEQLGLSAHGGIVPEDGVPMVEYHLKLDEVETPDSAFSLTAEELRVMVGCIRAT